MRHFNQVIFAFFLLSVIGISSAEAQTRQGGITYGLHAGVTVFRLSGLEHFDPNFTSPTGLDVQDKVGFMAGGFAAIPLSKNFTLQPEVNFQMQGAKLHYTGLVGDIAGVQMDDQYRLYYLNVPVLAKYRIPTTSLQVYAGPQAGWMVNAKYVHQMKNYEKSTQGITDQVQRFDVAGVYGLEYDFPVENSAHRVVLSARYTSGFSDAFKDGYEYLKDKSKNQGFVVSFGFIF